MPFTLTRREFINTLAKELCSELQQSCGEDGSSHTKKRKLENGVTGRVLCNEVSCKNKTSLACTDCNKKFCGNHSHKLIKCHSCMHN